MVTNIYDLKEGQKVTVGDFDSDYSAIVTKVTENQIFVEVNKYGNKFEVEIDLINYWIAGVLQ